MKTFKTWIELNENKDHLQQVKELRAKMDDIYKQANRYKDDDAQGWNSRWPEYQKYKDQCEDLIKQHYSSIQDFSKPQWADFWSVDEVIESLSPGEKAEQELMQLMPNI
jgi:hypothetical protein